MSLTNILEAAGFQRSPTNTHGLRLKLPRIDCPEAWELYRLAAYFGGVEIRESFFIYPHEEQCIRARDAIWFRFGNGYAEYAEIDGNKNREPVPIT